MGKVKDGSATTPLAKPKPSKAPANGPARPGRFGLFFANLARADRYKPIQGKIARRATTIALAAIVILGLIQLGFQLENYSKPIQLGVPTLLGVIFGWIIYRVVEYPPFVEFLIATEAEMNKVSWTTRDELRRATIVVLVTVAVMAIFLFGVDFLWQFLLKLIHVLRFSDTSDLGSNA